MDVLLIVVLVGAAVAAGWYDRSSVRDAYAAVYSMRHGHVPPLLDWFVKADPDPDVEAWRRYHRKLWVIAGGLGAGAIAVGIASWLTVE